MHVVGNLLENTFGQNEHKQLFVLGMIMVLVPCFQRVDPKSGPDQ